MSDEVAIHKVLIIGTYQATDAYPNVKYKIEAIKSDSSIHCVERNSGINLSVDYGTKVSKYISLIRIALALSAKLFSCLRHVISHRDAHVIYIPYPAIHILLAIGLLPKPLRSKRIIADVFISLYDTIVLDRKLLQLDSPLADVLKILECRAMTVANNLVTDTTESATHIANLLDMDIAKFTAIPLATNEATFTPHTTQLNLERPLAVIFIGTLVPLHGIETILEALQSIESTVEMSMTFVGDGQEREKLESFLASDERRSGSIAYRWIKDWQSSSQLHELIGQSELCIGIMKNTGKSARVWPLKNYMYMASGRALITAQTPVSDRLSKQVPSSPFITVDTSNSIELAARLKHFAIQRYELKQIADSGRHLYDKTLSNTFGYAQLKNLITE